MNTKKFIGYGLGLGLSLFVGCYDRNIQRSNGVVFYLSRDAETFYIATTKTEQNTQKVISSSGGYGIDLEIVVEDITPGVLIGPEDVYEIVFRCEDGSYISSEGKGKTHKDLYEKLKKGEKVSISYKKGAPSFSFDMDKDGKPDLIRVLSEDALVDVQGIK